MIGQSDRLFIDLKEEGGLLKSNRKLSMRYFRHFKQQTGETYNQRIRVRSMLRAVMTLHRVSGP